MANGRQLCTAIPIGPLIGGVAVIFILAFCIFTEFAYRRAGTGIAGQFATPPYEPATPLPLDIYGSVLITLSLGLITYGLLEAGREGYFHRLEVVVLVAGAFLLAVFFRVETRIKNPMLPMFLMKDRRFLLVSVQTLVLFAGFQSRRCISLVFYISSRLAIPPCKRGRRLTDF